MLPHITDEELQALRRKTYAAMGSLLLWRPGAPAPPSYEEFMDAAAPNVVAQLLELIERQRAKLGRHQATVDALRTTHTDGFNAGSDWAREWTLRQTAAALYWEAGEALLRLDDHNPGLTRVHIESFHAAVLAMAEFIELAWKECADG